ncbi:efflux RND transporter periplasmic adaptor subunit [Tenacibaculum ovolyticum]|uniref:efflux RND transporter periplasmic adaptor subunit n=1 Tax=Tenacibaculum ovolyticum TaxID=104270 RepID=UPI00041AA991|nr:efflux RND transporter periplasmic adaptor subunit [Tenacibaculum ovolyticum]
MKKYIIYIGFITIGLLFGWFLFGNPSAEKIEHEHSQTVEKKQLWTCSMHPKIMKSEAGDCPICGMDLILTENSSEGLMADQFKLTRNAIALANIQTSIVGNDKIEDNTIKLSGKIVENEEANTVQISYFSGRIERLNINSKGAKVRKGQLLATIYSPELFAAQQELITASSLKETQPALYKAVRNKLKLWKLSKNQINKIETSGKVKENFPVYATVSGTVSEKLVAEGESIKLGQPLFKIANLNTVWVNFDIYEHQIDLFKKGQDIFIITNSTKKINAKVDFIDPVLDSKTRTVKLRVVLNNKNDEFKPGMFVEGKITGINSNEGEVVSIPASAVLWTGKRSVVYLKPNDNEPVFEMREITLGNRIGNNYEVLQGIKKGDEIVTNGTFTVDAAAQLQGKKSMMNKKGGKVMTGHENHLGMNNNSTVNNFNKNERIEVSEEFQNQLKTVFNDYIQLKNALVKGDTNKVIRASKKIIENISKIDMKLLKDNKTHRNWMSLEKEIKAATTSIYKTIDIVEQRSHFIQLSSSLITTVQVFGINEKVYVEFCPMANSNKGAYWLSKEEVVMNPYYGDAMLKCGEVKQILD